jgi:hypothetical protein
MEKHKTLSSFTKAVNDLGRKEAAKLNGLFKGVHHDFPEHMLEDDWRGGLTPKQVLVRITEEAEQEGWAEARGS